MLLPHSFIAYTARELTRRLAASAADIPHPDALSRRFLTLIIDELSLEDEINAEARELLNQYSEYMRHQKIPYQEMFWKVKRQILAERKVLSAQSREGDRTMKLSRDKVNELSHKLAALMPRTEGVRMKKAWNDVRLEIVRELRDILTKEEMVDRKAQEKVASHSRDIPEGSEEWKVLYRRYYEDEMKRFGINLEAAV